ncbi:rhodanese superfamily protein [Planctomycetes bacterium Poly30]|uniref:tRNA uridine(34) hydroxylase n=1 Tax=Saltatorellus ferox TaxID=2528018 RepID=A0A518EY89_9BACT|nr:rhodanese superfamily protein [Planctomycetes bacterium Poly30]
MSRIVNIAAYQFATLEGLPELRESFLVLSRDLQLRGTIMLSEEGINLVVAGSRESIDALVAHIRALPGLSDLETKESLSDAQPFRRMRVKIKREIIAFGVEGIDPRSHTAPRITATELKQWLDEGRPFTLLDTRNDFEVAAGTFKNAIPIRVQNFRDFPKAVQALPESLKATPVVTFCTGGIRCEKAAPYLEQANFEEVYQLDGGILKYFEEVGGAHYEGTCVVFDERESLTPALTPHPLP